MSPTSHGPAVPTGWRKSSYSTAGNDCVEVARAGAAWAVRDSKDSGGGHLVVDAVAWREFTGRIKKGDRFPEAASPRA
jgi:hypothetical protein